MHGLLCSAATFFFPEYIGSIAFHERVFSSTPKALFNLPYIIRLLFSVGTVFFSHNNSAGTVFFSQFQPKFRPTNGAQMATRIVFSHTYFFGGPNGHATNYRRKSFQNSSSCSGQMDIRSKRTCRMLIRSTESVFTKTAVQLHNIPLRISAP